LSLFFLALVEAPPTDTPFLIIRGRWSAVRCPAAPHEVALSGRKGVGQRWAVRGNGSNLFNNFTWFTTNPTLGDQFHQSDDRIYSGGAVSRTFNGTLFNLPSQTVFGLQTPDDDINVGLTNTFHREFLSNTLFDHVNEGNVGFYAQNTISGLEVRKGPYWADVGDFDNAGALNISLRE
jgi:hypothetical protein